MLVSVNNPEKSISFCLVALLVSLQIGKGDLMTCGHRKMGVLLAFSGRGSTNLAFG